MSDRRAGPWIASVMPIRQYADLFEVETQWRWSGVHDQRTAQDRLDNFDSHRDEIERVLARSMAARPRCGCGAGTASCSPPAGLFGYAGGSAWGVSQYRVKGPVNESFTDSCVSP